MNYYSHGKKCQHADKGSTLLQSAFYVSIHRYVQIRYEQCRTCDASINHQADGSRGNNATRLDCEADGRRDNDDRKREENAYDCRTSSDAFAILLFVWRFDGNGG